MLPKIIKAFNAFFEDESWAGTFDEVTVGKIARKTEDYRGAGMAAAIKVDMGYEMPEISINLKEYNSKLIKAWGECETDGVLLRLMAGAKTDGPGCKTDRIEIVLRGRPNDIDFGSWKPGEMTDSKMMFCPAYFKLSINGEELIELDPVNMIENVGGLDRYEKLRTAIGI